MLFFLVAITSVSVDVEQIVISEESSAEIVSNVTKTVANLFNIPESSLIISDS